MFTKLDLIEPHSKNPRGTTADSDGMRLQFDLIKNDFLL